MAHNQADDLDQLLDSMHLSLSLSLSISPSALTVISSFQGALDDFQTLNVTSSLQSSVVGSEKKEDFPPPLPSGVQGLGMGLPDLGSKKRKGKQKVSKDAHVAEALDKLKEQTVEAVKGLEFGAGLKSSVGGGGGGGDEVVEEWLKQFADLHEEDMEAVVATMMQQILSKETLHEPMKELGERYQKWLEEHKNSLSKEDFEHYSQQYEMMQNLNEVYEKEPENYSKIFELMQKMQECGLPPSDVCPELANGLDFNSLGQLSPEMLESQPNCCIM